MTRPVVVLPQPDSPTSPSVSPRLTKKLTSSTALTLATVRWKRMPFVIGKYFLRFFTSSRMSPCPFVETISVVGVATVSDKGHLLGRLQGVALEPAQRIMVLGHRAQRRPFGALLLDIAAARREGAALRRVDQIRRQALDRDQALLALLVQTGDRLQEAHRVGVLGVAEGLAR